MRVALSRRSWSLATLVVGTAVSLSCGGDGGSPSPTPTDVVVTPGADTLVALGETRAFTASVLDANGDPIDGATVTWSSDAPTVLSIDPTTGLATALTRGNAHVKATAGSLEGTASVLVTQIVTSVTVTPGNAALDGVGDTVRFTAVAKDSGGTVVTGVQVIWSVNDNTVATIDTLGLATAKGAGVVLVTALAQTRAGYAALGVTQTAATVAFTAIPDSGKAGTPFAEVVQVEVRDSNGHRVRNASLPVTIGVVGGNGPFGMVGSTTITTIDGVTNFPGLGVTRAGSLQLTASAPGLVTATSAAFPVAPEAPHHLAVVSLKDTMTAGDTLQASIALQDRYANRTHVNGLWVQISMRREFSPGLFTEGFLVGQQSYQTVDGQVTSFEARVTAAGYPWQLVATAPGYDSAFGGAARVLPGAPARTFVNWTGLAFLSPWMSVGAARSPGLVAYITDQYLNPQPNAPATLLTLSDSAWSGGVPGEPGATQTIFGVLQATTVAGVAHFDTVGVRRPGMTALVAAGGGYLPYANNIDARIYGKHGLTAGNKHACILGDGGPYCWGDNSFGQLSGAGAIDSIARPVIGGGALVSVFAGGNHSCGLLADGTAMCWGANAAGQLGRGTNTTAEPVIAAVATGVKFSSLSLGASHTCGIGLTDSLAYCWGSNSNSQLGDSTTSDHNLPAVIKGGHKFVQLALGTNHSCGLEAGATGSIWCWGRNDDGEGGHNYFSFVPDVPKVVVEDSNLSVRAGNGFTCAEYRTPSASVQVRCWGTNIYGHLGSDTLTSNSNPMPTTIIGVGAVRPGTLSLGLDHACVVAATDLLWCWGRNQDNQWLNTGIASFPRPFQTNIWGTIPAGASLGLGGTFTCVVTPPAGFGVTVGDTRCWGRPNDGSLGNGRTTPQLTPPPALAVQ